MHRRRGDFPQQELPEPELGVRADVYAAAAAFYVALLKNQLLDEAEEFAAWFLETFDLDLET